MRLPVSPLPSYLTRQIRHFSMESGENEEREGGDKKVYLLQTNEDNECGAGIRDYGGR